MNEKTEIVLIGGSAGSLGIILNTISQLKENIAFPIIVVVHRKAQTESIMPKLFQRFTTKRVLEVEDKMCLNPDCIYVVPSDYHMLFENKKTVSLDASEKVNFSRPSIDVTFRSASEVFKKFTVGILLSGANADGVEGLNYIAKNGGEIWIQDPQSADVEYMPQYAMDHVHYHCIFHPNNLAKKINEL